MVIFSIKLIMSVYLFSSIIIRVVEMLCLMILFFVKVDDMSYEVFLQFLHYKFVNFKEGWNCMVNFSCGFVSCNETNCLGGDSEFDFLVEQFLIKLYLYLIQNSDYQNPFPLRRRDDTKKVVISMLHCGTLCLNF